MTPPSGGTVDLHDQVIRQNCRTLKTPAIAAQDQGLAEAAVRIADLAAGRYIARAEPVLLIGEAGTGKTHLASGLCVAACEQRRRVRFTTATALVNELVEARAANTLSRALGRWERIELIGIDELGYVPLAEIGAELLFQVIADRAER